MEGRDEMGQSSLQDPPPTCSLPTATDPCAPLDLDDGTAKKKKKRGVGGLGCSLLRQCVTRPAGAERESLFPVLTPITHKVLILYDRCHHHPSPHHPLSGPRQPPVFLSSLPHNYDNSPTIPSSPSSAAQTPSHLQELDPGTAPRGAGRAGAHCRLK